MCTDVHGLVRICGKENIRIDLAAETLSAVIACCAAAGQTDKAREALDAKRASGAPPSAADFSAVLYGCALRWDEALNMVHELRKGGFTP
eukprot:2763979-Prymnesium_polylepis.1